MKRKFVKTKNLLLLSLLSVILLGACREDDQPMETNEYTPINNWIQREMDLYYLWLEEMRQPFSGNPAPDDYFKSLLYSNDRFSSIFENAQELTEGLGGTSMEAGYEFNLYRTSEENDNVIAEVSYIKKGSPAESKDILRGDVIAAINGVGFTTSNYRQLISDMSRPHTITYFRYDGGAFAQKPDLDMEVTRVSENPNFMDTVYTINNQKIGYVVYHFFAPSTNPTDPNTPPVYDIEMDGIFERLKGEGVEHLVVDFRYNSGGYVSSAVNLASLIGTGVGSSTIFSKTRYNSLIMSDDRFNNVQTPFLDKSQNIGSQLSGNRVYILTSSRTASASELIINSLRPYMDVVIIGDQTVGKNVGSIVIEDEDDPSNNWALFPVISQSYNSQDQSDYGDGFTPDVEAQEFTERLLPFGDVNEILLRTAIAEITGTPPVGRFEKLDRIDLGSTIDHKIRTGVMVEDIDAKRLIKK